LKFLLKEFQVIKITVKKKIISGLSYFEKSVSEAGAIKISG